MISLFVPLDNFLNNRLNRGTIIMLRSQLKYSVRRARYFSDSAVKPAAAKPAEGSQNTLVHRVTSFIVGAGVGFAANMYLMREELLESNKRFEKTLRAIQEDLKKCKKEEK